MSEKRPVYLISFIALKKWWAGFCAFLFPPLCAVCGTPLQSGEECICTRCNVNMPRTNYHLWPGNPMERLFWGKIPVERATAFFFYRKGSDYRRIIYRLKYHGKKEIGRVMGAYVAAELKPSGFFDGIDVLVPLPLHAKRLRKRGYNQSLWIAMGISRVTGIPVSNNVIIRSKYTLTQTHKSVMDRWENVKGIFSLTDCDVLKNKHVLIVDDVITSGATTCACAECLLQCQGVRVSVLTLAVANL